MITKEKYIQRINQLLEKAQEMKIFSRPLSPNVAGNFTILDKTNFSKWRNSAQNLITQLTGEDSHYLKNFLEQVVVEYSDQLDIGIGILESLREELELGFFLGRLGRECVCVLYRKDVEIPSDYQGVLFVEVEKTDGWQIKLAREIKKAGLDVDLNLLA